jgi:hypothetical protein
MSEQSNKPQFPTEVVSLPSKGYFYSSDSPLVSGEIELRYPTAKDEDILTSQNLIKKGIVIDKLLESLVVNKDINLNDIIIGDKNAIMIAARILAYGKEYAFETNCSACAEHNRDSIDLTSLEDKNVKFDDLEKGRNEFEFNLPHSKRNIKFKFLTQADEREISQELNALKKIMKGSRIDSEVTTRMKKIIVSVDGEVNQQKINQFVDNDFLSRDSFAFREYIQCMTPDIDMSYNFECSLCGYEEEVTVPMTVQFFWPKTRR